MRLVVADTGPVNYLIQIGQIELLPLLFETIALPLAVERELSDPLAPPLVQRWISAPPAWLEIHDTAGLPYVSDLDAGEPPRLRLPNPFTRTYCSWTNVREFAWPNAKACATLASTPALSATSRHTW